MDGVIADTQRLHARVEELVLRKRGIVISAEEITRKYAGLSDEEFFKLWNGKVSKGDRLKACCCLFLTQKVCEALRCHRN